MHSLLFALLLASVPFAAGQTAPKPAKPAPVKPTPTAGVSDAHIEQQIRARFAKSKIAKNQFQVRVQGGTATLSGSTDIVQHKATATRLAKLGGARAVLNQIQISEAARHKASEGLERARRATVKRSE